MKKFIKTAAVASALIMGSSIGFSANAANVKITPISAKSDIIAVANDEPKTTLEVTGELPEKYSSRDLGFQTPIRNQGTTNICWSFAAMASLETRLVKDNKISPVQSSWFSVSHPDAWATPRNDGSGWVRNYQKSNGFPFISTGYLTSWSGAIKEEKFPFLSPLSMFEPAKKEDVQYGVTGIMYLNGDDKDTIKKCIMDYGAVTSSYNSNSKFTKNSTNTYCPEKQPVENIVGHNISVVGWDDNYSKDNFLTPPPEDGAWLIKNSWGPNSEFGGYAWISYYDYYLFSNVFGITYCYTDYMTVEEHNNIYQNEIDGAVYEFNYLDDILYHYSKDNPNDLVPYTLGLKDNVYINVLDFNKDNEFLDKIVFETTSIGADYTLYYIPTDSEGVPTVQENLWKELGSGKVDYSGYICADIENFPIPSEKAAIGVRIDTTSVADKEIKNGIGVSEWLTNGDTLLYNTDAKKGESFLYFDEEMMDVMDFYKQYCGDDQGGTLVIKAITTKESSILGDANLDGILDISDASLIQKYTIHSQDLSEQSLINSDFNKDGKVNILDCTQIQKKIAGLIE